MDEDKGIVWQVVTIGAILIALASGLLWLGVRGMLPTAAGIGSSLDPNIRTIGIIVILAVVALIAWLALPKGRGTR